MKPRGPFRHAAVREGKARARGRGFTLLEMCMVLLIMAILAMVMIPALQSVLVESEVRADSRQISVMVRTAMLQSSDEHRPYVIDFTPTSLDLHPAKAVVPETANADNSSAPKDESVPYQLDRANQLLVPDSDKANKWLPMTDREWFFTPGDLCPATRIRLQRGNSWVEMSFNALTGNVENETAYFP